MQLLPDRLNAPSRTDEALKDALSRLWYVTARRPDKGNGRVGLAGANMLLARSERTSQQFYSMSGQILLERAGHYDVLERSQRAATAQNFVSGIEDELARVLN